MRRGGDDVVDERPAEALLQREVLIDELDVFVEERVVVGLCPEVLRDVLQRRRDVREGVDGAERLREERRDRADELVRGGGCFGKLRRRDGGRGEGKKRLARVLLRPQTAPLRQPYDVARGGEERRLGVPRRGEERRREEPKDRRDQRLGRADRRVRRL